MKQFFSRLPRKQILLGLACAILLIAVAWIVQRNRTTPLAVTTSTPTPVTTPTSTTSEVNTSSPSPSASPTPSPTISPSASSTALPESAQTFLKSFYTNYGNQSSAALEKNFTPDSSNLRATLFTGMDQKGIPGGPTLFSTNSAGERATSYSITSTTRTSQGWLVTATEQRVDAQGKPVTATTTTQITLVPSGSSWLIDAYTRPGQSGKYNAFLSQ